MNINPTPQAGMGAFGMVPGALSAITPPNPAQDLAAVAPNLSSLTGTATNDVLGELSGNISPGTLAALRNAAATWGVGSGTGMGVGGIGGLAQNQLFGNVAGFAENQIAKGLQGYNQTIPTISSTQTLSPALNLQGQQFNTEIAASNALNAAAPSPQAAQSYAQKLFQQYLNSMRGPAGGASAGGRRGDDWSFNPDMSWATGPANPAGMVGSGLRGGVTPWQPNVPNDPMTDPYIDPNTGMDIEDANWNAGSDYDPNYPV